MRTHSTNLNGPVPTGFVPMPCGSALNAAGDTIVPGASARIVGIAAVGTFSVISTVSGSSAFHPWKSLICARQRHRLAGLLVRSKLATTAAASSGVPSWNLMP